MSSNLHRVTLIFLIFFIILPTFLYALSTFEGFAVCLAENNQVLPQLVSDGTGGFIVTWQDYRNTTLNPLQGVDIYAQRVNSAGELLWSENGVAICTAAYYQTSPQIVSDGAGGAIITWYDGRNGADFDIYAQRVNSIGSTLWTSNGIPLCTATGDQHVPRLVADGVGGAIVAWEDHRYDWLDGYVYAQRVSSTGSTLWTLNGVAICTVGSIQGAEMVADGFGGAIITWYDWRAFKTLADIYAQRVNSAGSPIWTLNGLALCTATSYQELPAIVADGSGGAIVTWMDERNSMIDENIYAQRVNNLGNTVWAQNGLGICTVDSVQVYPVICSDGLGGAIIAWEDSRIGPFDIYAQRVNGSGNTLWTKDGIMICDENNEQEYLQIIPDGTNGAIITWMDRRKMYIDPDIYAQRVNSSGAVLWTTDGVAICSNTCAQETPQLISDGSGGAFIVWTDYRNGTDNADIYTRQVYADGSLITPTTVPKEVWELF